MIDSTIHEDWRICSNEPTRVSVGTPLRKYNGKWNSLGSMVRFRVFRWRSVSQEMVNESFVSFQFHWRRFANNFVLCIVKRPVVFVFFEWWIDHQHVEKDI